MTFKVFNEHAEDYDRWYLRNEVIAVNEVKVLKYLKLNGLGLEVGVGSGFFASKIGIAVGVDPAVNMLYIARRRGVEVVQGVGERIPFRDNVFNYVVLIVTLCFVNNPAEVLAEVLRVVKDGGRVVTCVVPKDSQWGQYYMSKPSIFYSVAKFYTLSEVINLMTSHGLNVSRCVSTLTFNPWDEPLIEEPKELCKPLGFVCIEGVKDKHSQPPQVLH